MRAGRATLRAASCAAAAIFMVVAQAAAPAMLRRVSDDVVTAGLNSSRPRAHNRVKTQTHAEAYAAAAAANFAGKRSGLVFRGESVRADLVRTSSAALAWGGEVIKRLTRAQREAGELRHKFDDAAEHYSELEKHLAEMEVSRSKEKRAAEMHTAALETRGLRLEAEKAALLSEKKAMRAELDETKAAPRRRPSALRERISMDLGKEAFLNSSEFGTLCVKKALKYFKVGFSGCLAQFRANGYFEEEHPASFLDVKKALSDMEDEEAAEEEEEE
ncbi:hypothetical protein F511_22436 [Dorcoceras hygrometricum]|uniref:Uncharacterized protein n=1 Tax=Dorcoceras hygrometricum TaxID=472368 RepID=A0A2Z7AYE8_9LAMI|nr:hypothetical protein F511_22436 [Dorcoceras hygrometricum]